MIEEFDEYGPLNSRTTTPGKTPEQHSTDREISAAAKLLGRGMVPRTIEPEPQAFISRAYVRSIGKAYGRGMGTKRPRDGSGAGLRSSAH
jgi:hypothetical protein